MSHVHAHGRATVQRAQGRFERARRKQARRALRMGGTWQHRRRLAWQVRDSNRRQRAQRR